MNEIPCKFELLEPEFVDASVPNDNLIVFESHPDIVRIVVYFMANTAVTEFSGSAKSALGQITLKCAGKSPSGAFAASQVLRKVMYTFFDAQGISRNFIFEHTAT